MVVKLEHPKDPGDSAIGDFAEATRLRRRRIHALTMSERLAELHELCRQLSQLRGPTARH